MLYLRETQFSYLLQWTYQQIHRLLVNSHCHYVIQSILILEWSKTDYWFNNIIAVGSENETTSMYEKFETYDSS